MQHAIIILSHKNIEQLYHLVEYFSHDCCVFIHLDKKFKISHENRERLEAFPQVANVYQRFNVNWGGFSMLRCQMFMLRQVLKLCNADYVHLISSQDYPMMSLGEFLTFFEQYKNKDCLQYVHLPHMNWEHNTFQRIQYFYPFDWYSTRYQAWGKIRRFIHFQRTHGIKRSLPKGFDHLYGCSQWFSITRNSAQLLVDYTRQHPWLYWRMWMTFAPEEMYTATVLVNLKQGKDVLFTNFRFIRWKSENGNCPANLDVHHLRYLLEKPYAFVRKMEMPISQELQDVIDRYFVYDSQPLTYTKTGAWIYDGYKAYGYDTKFTDMIVQFCQFTGAETVLDAGCGCGMYVAMLRERKIAASGFDANPYTEELSVRLLDKEQEPCVQAELLDEELEAESPFDLVFCKEVLPYIPKPDIRKAIQNLAKFSGKYLLVSWQTEAVHTVQSMFTYSEEEMDSLLKDVGMTPDDILNRQLKVLNENTYHQYKIFIKQL